MRIGIMLLVLWCAVFAYSADAQHRSFVSASKVSVSISSERSTYKRGEPVELKYKVRNISRTALYIPRRVWDEIACPNPPHFWAHLVDASGKQFPSGFGGSCLGPKAASVAERMKRDALLLKPGETYEGSFALDTAMFRNQLMPGDYRVVGTFSGFRDDQFKPSEAAELRALGHPLLGGQISASTAIKMTF